MLNTRLGIVQFRTLGARNCCNCLIQITSKFQRHNAQPITPVGNGDVLDIVVHKNVRLSDVIVSGILPVMFHIPDHVRTKQIHLTNLQIGSGFKA
jgi:hypothetical protein